MRKFRSMPSLLIAFFGSSHADDVVVAVNCFSKMMMAAGAESPAVATQSAKTDILQKIEEQRGTSNNHEREQDIHEEEDDDLVEENIVDEEQEAKTPPSSPPHSMPSNDKMSKEVCFS